MSAADALAVADKEATRTAAERATLEDAGTDPAAIATIRVADELAQRRVAEAQVAANAEREAQRLREQDQFLDTVNPILDAAHRALWDAVEALRPAIDAVLTAYDDQAQTARYLVGTVTSTIQPSTTSRVTTGLEGVRVDGQVIRSLREVSATVAVMVAPLIAVGLPALADGVRAGAAGLPKLRQPSN